MRYSNNFFNFHTSRKPQYTLILGLFGGTRAFGLKTRFQHLLLASLFGTDGSLDFLDGRLVRLGGGGVRQLEGGQNDRDAKKKEMQNKKDNKLGVWIYPPTHTKKTNTRMQYHITTNIWYPKKLNDGSMESKPPSSDNQLTVLSCSICCCKRTSSEHVFFCSSIDFCRTFSRS